MSIMDYTAPTITDRAALGDNKYTIQYLDDGRVLLTPAPDSVAEEGTPINKALLQPIVDALAEIKNLDVKNLANSAEWQSLTITSANFAYDRTDDGGEMFYKADLGISKNRCAAIIIGKPTIVLTDTANDLGRNINWAFGVLGGSYSGIDEYYNDASSTISGTFSEYKIALSALTLYNRYSDDEVYETGVKLNLKADGDKWILELSKDAEYITISSVNLPIAYILI